MFFAISTINSRTALTFTATFLLKSLSIWMTRAIVQVTPFFLPSVFEFFRLFHLLETLLIQMTVSFMVSTLFLSPMIEFSWLFHLIFSLQFSFVIPYFVTWFFAVLTSDESSRHRWLPKFFPTPTIRLLIHFGLFIIFCNWHPFRMTDEDRSHHPFESVLNSNQGLVSLQVLLSSTFQLATRQGLLCSSAPLRLFRPKH